MYSIQLAVTKSGTGTWDSDMGLRDSGMWDLGMQGHGAWGRGTRGYGDLEMQGCGDVRFGDVKT